jgi:hypothetical protein
MLRSSHPDRRKDPYPGSESGELELAREGVGAEVETKALAESIVYGFSRHELSKGFLTTVKKKTLCKKIFP